MRSATDGAAEMLVSFLRRRLGSVLYLLHRVCVVFCATEAAALTVMLLSLQLRCWHNCADLTGAISSLRLLLQKGSSIDCFIDVVDVTCLSLIHI